MHSPTARYLSMYLSKEGILYTASKARMIMDKIPIQKSTKVESSNTTETPLANMLPCFSEYE